MGLGESKAFSRDILVVEISGPDRPQLTLVDLPGLIHAKNKSQSREDVKLIRTLVKEYISNKRTIMLAIISAKNDYANQIILDYCRDDDVDPRGERTLGVITKPDFLRPGSENEKSWIDLACNKDINLDLGWHMVKNRVEGDNTSSFDARNESERLFFSKHPYCELSSDMVGIDGLRSRLSRVLRDHLIKELPELRRELNALLNKTKEELSHFGASRSSIGEQRRYLTTVAMNVWKLTDAAIQGQYNHNFFGSVAMGAAVDQGGNTTRLRAIIQDLNLEFARNMRLYGRKYPIKEKSDHKDKPQNEDTERARMFGDCDVELATEEIEVCRITAPDEDSEFELPQPQTITHSEAINWVCEVLRRTRGKELPGNFDPQLIGYLFHEQSEPWNYIAIIHITRVTAACVAFVKTVLASSTTADIAARLMDRKVEPGLKKALDSAEEELRKIMNDKALHPITYNHYYTNTIQRMRKARYQGEINKLLETATVNVPMLKPDSYEMKPFVCLNRFRKGLNDTRIQEDMEKFSAEDALDCENAYYRDEMKYFINVVTKQVIERHLIQTLPDMVLAPISVAGMSDDQITYLATEPVDMIRKRKILENRQAMLEDGQKTFERATGQYR
ncbi:Dynamin [Orbilia brochopaga]|nr:Dynamin [Drechslerella brochopaga]